MSIQVDFDNLTGSIILHHSSLHTLILESIGRQIYDKFSGEAISYNTKAAIQSYANNLLYFMEFQRYITPIYYDKFQIRTILPQLKCEDYYRYFFNKLEAK